MEIAFRRRLSNGHYELRAIAIDTAVYLHGTWRVDATATP